LQDVYFLYTHYAYTYTYTHYVT